MKTLQDAIDKAAELNGKVEILPVGKKLFINVWAPIAGSHKNGRRKNSNMFIASLTLDQP